MKAADREICLVREKKKKKLKSKHFGVRVSCHLLGAVKDTWQCASQWHITGGISKEKKWAIIIFNISNFLLHYDLLSRNETKIQKQKWGKKKKKRFAPKIR